MKIPLSSPNLPHEHLLADGLNSISAPWLSCQGNFMQENVMKRKTGLTICNAMVALTRKKAELMQTLGDRGGIAVGDRTPDPLDEVQAATSRDLAVLELNRDACLLEQVQAAIARMNAGEYGTCQHCEKDIPPTRLTAVPWAEYCVPCQTLIEQGLDIRQDQGPHLGHLRPAESF